ncbi:hypothetical protein Godav_027174 [Gossypium davidsonii]|uniref:F-box domain-containing protein n=1 Tax=Gossypium davidsonii TaxID=34287 RepID=A0A7J8RWT0_GOSDV|nr:hypothetical protein [Gossypium davidsonii]
MSDHNPKEPNINSLSLDLTQLIFSSLPLPSLLRASAVCKLWNSLISSPSFTSPCLSYPWFFLFGLHNTSSRNNQSFAFDPLSNAWFLLPRLDDPSSSSAFLGSNGFFFTTTPNFSYTPVLKSAWRFTSPLKFSRLNPLLGVFYDGSSGGFGFKFIVVGGVRFIGGLVDIEDRLAVEIYDPNRDSWELCPALPADFRSGNSSQSLSSALFKGKFYVSGIYSCFVSSFDLRNRVWSEVQTLRPPGVIFSFLIPCNDMLVLAGMCNAPRGPSFNLWKIDETTLEFSEISIMPQSLLHSLVESEEDENFASLKCVGMGNLIYVFNEEYHQKYPSCLCEISAENGKCSWRRVPRLPLPLAQRQVQQQIIKNPTNCGCKTESCFHAEMSLKMPATVQYQKVEKPKPESPINENEIRITSQGAIRNYINYAIALLQDKHVKEIVLKAMGQAISKTVAIAEILKKRIPRLHQDTSISSVSITDVWEPIEEGLVPVEMTRHVSMISITLSTRELNKNSVGYQAPHYAEQPKPQYHYQQQQPPKQGRIPYNAVNEGIHMAEVGVAVEAEGGGGVGAGVAMEIIKIMVDIQTGAEVVGEEEVGVIVVLVMKEVEVEVVEALAVAVGGWVVVVAQGVVATEA